MAHVWNEKFRALYDRTYRVLYDAGLNEKLADEMAKHRTIAVALKSSERPSRFSAPERTMLDDFRP